MLGAGIKAERRRCGLSLAKLAENTGITASALSQIENGLKEPSLSSLRRIAKALDVPIFRFLADGYCSDIVVRRDERRRLNFPNTSMVWEDLTPDSRGHIDMFIINLNPNEATRVELGLHDGDECLLVLSGSIEFQVEDRTYRLGEGDSIYIHRGFRHLARNTGKQQARLISAIAITRY